MKCQDCGADIVFGFLCGPCWKARSDRELERVAEMDRRNALWDEYIARQENRCIESNLLLERILHQLVRP